MRQWGFRKKKLSGRKKRYLLLSGIFILTVLLNVLAWKSTAFCDFYVDNIYPLWVNTYGRFMGIFPFSVGEIMVAAGVAFTAAALLLAGVAAVFFISGEIKRRKAAKKKAGSESFTGYILPLMPGFLQELLQS